VRKGFRVPTEPNRGHVQTDSVSYASGQPAS
jgi:hypothetical protein